MEQCDEPSRRHRHRSQLLHWDMWFALNFLALFRGECALQEAASSTPLGWRQSRTMVVYGVGLLGGSLNRTSPPHTQPEQGVEGEGDAQGSPQRDQTVLGIGGAWSGCGQPWGWSPGCETPCGLEGEASFWVWEVLELSPTRPTQSQLPPSLLGPPQTTFGLGCVGRPTPPLGAGKKDKAALQSQPTIPLILQIWGMRKSLFCSGAGRERAAKPS